MPQSPRRRARTAPPAPLSRTRRPSRRAALAGFVLLAAVVIVAILLNRHSAAAAPAHITPEVRSAPYSSYSACLLTDKAGLADPTAKATWAGMQAAAGRTHAQVRYLTLQGSETASNAGVYINTFALRGCSMVLAAGSVPAAGAQARAGYWPHLPVVAVVPAASAATPSSAPSAPANLTFVRDTTAAALTARIESILVGASSAAPLATH